jgi:hypothetical protein
MFGKSPFLETSDYEVRRDISDVLLVLSLHLAVRLRHGGNWRCRLVQVAPELDGAMSRFSLTDREMNIRLTPAAVAYLSTTQHNQFRGRLSEKTFSNRNGRRSRALESPASAWRRTH